VRYVRADLTAAKIEIVRLRSLFGRYVACVVSYEGHDYLPGGPSEDFSAEEVAEIEGYLSAVENATQTPVTQADAGTSEGGHVSD
jgi:hypothetical protein